jgi:hypothetical protein
VNVSAASRKYLIIPLLLEEVMKRKTLSTCVNYTPPEHALFDIIGSDGAAHWFVRFIIPCEDMGRIFGEIDLLHRERGVLTISG